jgi:hypothetical protein
VHRAERAQFLAQRALVARAASAPVVADDDTGEDFLAVMPIGHPDGRVVDAPRVAQQHLVVQG